MNVSFEIFQFACSFCWIYQFNLCRCYISFREYNLGRYANVS